MTTKAKSRNASSDSKDSNNDSDKMSNRSSFLP